MTQAKMSSNSKWALGLMSLVIVILLFVAFSSNEVSLDGYISAEQAQANMAAAVSEADSNSAEMIASLQAQIDAPVVSEEEAEISLGGYLVDELLLSDPFLEESYSDRELSLFDGEVRFDGDNYDAEEVLVLKDIELLANGHDYDEQVFMNVPEGAIAYSLNFDSDLNTSLISDEESLSFDFLGEQYEVSEWNGNSMVLSKGTEYLLDSGESVLVDGREVLLEFVGDDAVYVQVDGEGRSIDEGQVRQLNGLEIKVNDVFSSDSRSFAVLIIGEDIESVIEDGEEYEEDSAWKWVISANSIGIVLAEDFDEVDADGDEEFQAVAMGESLCLPNDYVCIQFNGLSEESEEEYNLELDEKDSVHYVRIDGNFQSGTSDYDRVYVNVSGIYDRDLELIDSDEIGLGDTDSKLVINATHLVFEDFEDNYALDTSIVGTDDEDFLTNYGILVSNPDDSAEDLEWTIAIPEEKLEGSFSLLM